MCSLKKTLISLFFLVSCSFRVFPCSCIEKPAIPIAIAQSDFVAVIKVLKKEYIKLYDTTIVNRNSKDNSRMEFFATSLAKYKVLVKRLVKGEIDEKIITIYSGTSDSDCGVKFREGRRFIVYASKTSFKSKAYDYPAGINVFYTSLCTRTEVFTKGEYLKILKEKKAEYKIRINYAYALVRVTNQLETYPRKVLFLEGHALGQQKPPQYDHTKYHSNHRIPNSPNI